MEDLHLLSFASFPGALRVGSTARKRIDLPAQTVTTPGGTGFKFTIDAFRKHCLVNGLDEIGLTLRHADKIRAYEAQRAVREPWVFT